MSFKITHGDCLDKLKKLPDNSIDSIVTDPPYGLSFMGKKWDYDVPTVAIWKECLRVLKPGGHLLAFGGTRTYHRLVVAIEDAGFEIRDQIQWIYGSGFPKSQNIAKAAGDESLAGLGTALKPANEPICLARKPLSESTIAKNVLKHGTGGLNIDKARIETSEVKKNTSQFNAGFWQESGGNGERWTGNGTNNPLGRFPANVIFDEDAAAVLDGQAAQSVSRFFYQAKASKSDRGEGNTHPTVKPIKLMEYLCKLVTPEGGTVLDPFMGSGTTGVAALRIGFNFMGVEREENYFYIAQARLEKEQT